MNRLVTAIIAAGCMLSAPLVAAQSNEPDATIEFSGGTVAVGVGYSWAKGNPWLPATRTEVV